MSAYKDRQITGWLPAHVARNVGTAAAVLGVGVAVPAALFAQPYTMVIAAGAASVAAYMGVKASRDVSERRTGIPDRRGTEKPSQVVGTR